ncbi:uncharacterized protein OCT59_014544 [Rhizophagus irregularis]|uniref:Uncharacterized protein n=2 Tax=Rhizophagus irregularis TaxID=588596 RepID=U9U6H6_RHIID|nr:hypothetical protein GLOIN_2v1761378 [Rhizophagus irregularis DAOM 181602=DAOM 197198]EXX71973.1 hypothetical protein RirG_073750 [Rhizophagus irregularis DAOM 197198w]UZO22174.1 hypothetical protein OCT59_014544 [Rhizophagus irregularis]POG83325.1 hypothetical protein GLOIN_2v1761378 [Rhizophagus irregularis DAOM 181602=DAOM 197198]CAB5199040.1 unnamed protein product [Rhizophagus irregularis]GET55179.1 hypothetical protein GLOIN_2v1761378 [Rhizophagus irregularis DAOM 181602=DAOM 197198]|eukprot:XP_025190191.1 hypothetical protein GLOIN_2v1761378 [Rhizophagus irregularis DAOM 181602=DAOM 197198]
MMVLDHPDSNSSQPPPIPQNSPSIQSIPSISIPSQHLLDDSQVPSGLIPNNLLSTNVSSPCIEAHDHEAQELHSVYANINSKLDTLTTYIGRFIDSITCDRSTMEGVFDASSK